VLLALSALLAAFAVAVNHARLWDVRAELQVVADAASLAGAGTLLDDDTLRANTSLYPGLLARATAAADTFAQSNLVQGRPFTLQPNPANYVDGDLVFGTLDTPRSTQFIAAQNIQNPGNPALAKVNTVRVVARETAARGNAPLLIFAQFLDRRSADVQAAATASLDRDVIGFRPLGEHPLPLAPLALLSDTTAAEKRSWQYQVEARKGFDNYRFDPAARAFASGADGIYEFQAVLPLNADELPQANVALLLLGVSDAGGVSQQLLSGVTPEQLQGLGGELVLEASDNRLKVPGSALGPSEGSQQLKQLRAALDQLRQLAEPRLWPLYSGIDSSTGKPILCGFVAARVVTVGTLAAGQPLTCTLQATVVAESTAVTGATRRGVGGIPIVNPYISKVRLVE
jgi:hypothetical protein